ncbi:S8 family serine peptidase [Halovivax gelatinilyticus]|uniref:S8 family serine peptidase n=1 Tax=Halovivax gelatinilyticus TaxID=2961597 RepID=UPI0020CA3BDC|nr:S8 family serine peptidase [Halovivax gelatinilyticus]
MQSVEIEDGLQNATGEMEVIVRFGSVDSATVQSSDDPVNTLQRAANDSQVSLNQLADRSDAVTIERSYWLVNGALVTVDTERVAIEELARIDGVERIEENSKVTPPSTTVTEATDRTATTATDVTWGLDRINAPDVWETFGTRGDGVRVAVLDTGIDASHQDLDLHSDDPTDPTYPGGWAEFNEYGNDVSGSEPYDCGTHGTHVSGTVAGGDGSGTHIGVAPDVELMHGGVLVEENDDGSCFGWSSQVIGGMEWAIQNDADVISMSLGGERYSSQYPDAVRNAESAGVLVVASAGNTEEGSSTSPGNVYDSFAVGNSNFHDGIFSTSSGELVQKSEFPRPKSHWPGEWIVPDVAAPGTNVNSALPNDEYGFKTGTSMAAPHASGAVALIQSATDDDLSPGEITAALEATALKPDSWDEDDAMYVKGDKDSQYGAGIIDARAAVSKLVPATFEGTVVDDTTGDPVEGVTVTAVSGAETAEAKTDSDGSFAVEVAGDNAYDLTVDPEGYQAVTKDGEYVGSDQTLDLGTVSVIGTASLEGTISDAVTGEQLEHVSLTATDAHGGDQSYVAETDGTGEFELESVRGSVEYELTALAPGYEPRSVTTHVGDGESAVVDVALVGDSALSGSVTDRESGFEVKNATVSAVSDAGTYVTVSESDGTYAIDIPGNETAYEVSIVAEGYETETETIVVDGEVDHTRSLVGDSNITLSITESNFGDPIENATVTATNESVGSYDGTATVGEGTYLIENVSSASEYLITVDATGYETNSTAVSELTPDTTTDAGDLLLTGNATIEGTLVDAFGKTPDGEDVSIPNTTVDVERADASDSLTITNATDSDGSFELAVPGIGANYTVSASAPYYEGTSQTTASLEDNASTAFDLRLTGNATLSGAVNASGVQSESATISATTDATGWGDVTWYNETVDQIAVPGLGDTYTVSATSRGFSTNSTTLDTVTADDVFGTLTIEQRSHHFGIDDLSAPETAEEGDTVTVGATVANFGTADWNDTVSFYADGDRVTSQTVSLNGTENTSMGERDTTSVTFSHTVETPGVVDYAIASENETANATVTVEESSGGGFLPPPPTPEPSVSVLSMELADAEITVDESTGVLVELINTGDADGEQPLELAVDGAVVETATFDVPAGERIETTLSHAFDEPGTYQIDLDGQSVGTVTVDDPAPSDETTSDDQSADGDADDSTDASESPAVDDYSTDDDSADDAIPAFGVVATLLALAAVAFVHRRR